MSKLEQKLTKEQCKDFLRDMTINPLTGYKIDPKKKLSQTIKQICLAKINEQNNSSKGKKDDKNKDEKMKSKNEHDDCKDLGVDMYNKIAYHLNDPEKAFDLIKNSYGRFSKYSYNTTKKDISKEVTDQFMKRNGLWKTCCQIFRKGEPKQLDIIFNGKRKVGDLTNIELQNNNGLLVDCLINRLVRNIVYAPRNKQEEKKFIQLLKLLFDDVIYAAEESVKQKDMDRFIKILDLWSKTLRTFVPSLSNFLNTTSGFAISAQPNSVFGNELLKCISVITRSNFSAMRDLVLLSRESIDLNPDNEKIVKIHKYIFHVIYTPYLYIFEYDSKFKEDERCKLNSYIALLV